MGVRSLVWAVGLSVVGALGVATETLAQNNIIPDDTLGTEPSFVAPLSPTLDGIGGGAVRGQNLFHSFEMFDVGNGNGAYFVTTSDAINNIFARITGNEFSEILGFLGTTQQTNNGFTQANVDLYLINPNGVVFGPNSALDVGGSLIVTTADTIKFGADEFRASNPNLPSSVLTVDPSSYLFAQQLSANIVSFSASGNEFPGLRVPNRSSLTFLAGNVGINGQGREAGLHAFGGRVELAAVGGPGEINIGPEGELIIGEIVPNGEVLLTNQAQIDVSLNNGGDINIVAGDINITNGSYLNAGIDVGEGFEGSQAGDIILNATQGVTVESFSRIENSVESSAVGDAGKIEINSDTLRVIDVSQLISGTLGEGNAGNIIINVEDRVVFDGASIEGQLPSAAFSSVLPGGVGRGGNIAITTNSLEIIDGAQLLSNTLGNGNAGNVIINAENRVVFDGRSADGQLPSSAVSNVISGSVGSGGNVDITTNRLEVVNGAQLSSSTSGIGDAGNVLIKAEDVVFDGISANGQRSSAATSRVELGGVGRGGNVDITANSLEVLNGAELLSSTSGRGAAGSVLIKAEDRVVFSGTSADSQFLSSAISSVEPGGVGRGGNVEVITSSLEVLNGAQLLSSTFGDGDAGNVIITTEEIIVFDGIDAGNQFPSGAFSSVSPGGSGLGGNVEVTTNTLKVLNIAQLSSSTSGDGDAGNVIIIAEDILFDGISADGQLPSAAFSRVNFEGVGRGGNVEVITSSLEVLNGAQLSSSTSGDGDAGNVNIISDGRVVFSEKGSASSSVQPSGVGRGGNVEVTASSLEVLNGAQLSSNTFGEGDAGNVLINVEERVVFDGISSDGSTSSAAFSGVQKDAVGRGGNVEIITNSLEVLNGAQLSSNTLGRGDAGDVNIFSNESTVFDGISVDGQRLSGAASNVQLGGVGLGGNVAIVTDSLKVLNGAQLVSGTSGEGDAGNVTIITGGHTIFSGTSLAASSVELGGVGSGGNVEIIANSLEVLNGSQLISSTVGRGNAGNVIITTEDRVVFDGTSDDDQSPSGVISSVGQEGVGLGGNIEITANSLEVLNGSQLISSTVGRGNAGNVIITAEDHVVIDGISRVVIDGIISDGQFLSAVASSVESGGVGRGGDVEITTSSLEVLNEAGLFSDSLGEGDAGDIIIKEAKQLLILDGVITSTSETSSGGEVRIDVESATLRGNGDITTFVKDGSGNGGDITITGNFIIALDDSDIIASATEGRGGNISLNVRGFFGENFTLDSLTADPDTLDGNDRADINATGAANGVIIIPDISFIENSLSDLPDALISPDQILIASCISRANQDQGTFNVTGSGGLPTSPTSDILSTYPTSQIQSPTETTTTQWQLGDAINEATGVYQLADGRLALSQNCGQR